MSCFAGVTEDGIKQIEALYTTLDELKAGLVPVDTLAHALSGKGVDPEAFVGNIATLEEERGGMPIASLSVGVVPINTHIVHHVRNRCVTPGFCETGVLLLGS